MKPNHRLIAAAAAAAFLMATPWSGTAAADKTPPKRKAADLVLQDKYPPITAEQKALTELPWAKGAPAVVLLAAQQHEYVEAGDQVTERYHTYRRVKILTPAGVESFADFERSLYGDWRIQKIEARTILPNGQEIDAKDGIFRETSTGETADTDVKLVRIAWPQVQVGAILDLHFSVVVDGLPSVRWVVQETIPVVESRLVLQMPSNVQFRTLGVQMDEAETKPLTLRQSRNATYAWVWENQPGISGEPYMPPFDDAAKSLAIFPTRVMSGEAAQEFEWAHSWASWIKNERDWWDIWMKRKSHACAAFAKTAVEGKTTPSEKAEAIRQALRDKVRIRYKHFGSSAESADDILGRGFGGSGEVAAVAVTMLRAVDVPATLVAFRPRSDGAMPTAVPLPVLLNDALVRFPGEKGPVYFSMTEPVPVGAPLAEARGAAVIPLDATTTAPVVLPDATAGENRVARIAKVALDLQGNIDGELTATYRGRWAADWRERLSGLDQVRREEKVREWLWRYMPGSTVSALEIENLDAGDKELIVKVSWRCEGYAIPAGGRLLVNLNLFAREEPAAWASDSRVTDLDFESAFDVVDAITLTLPEGVGEVTVPGAANLNAPPVGRYSSAHTRGGSLVSYRRQMRIDQYRVSRDAYPTLKSWFRDIAKADQQPVVVPVP